MVGSEVRGAFPGLCHVSGGDLARLATADDARSFSPLLNNIGRLLADSRRRKAAARRLVEVVTAVLADGVRSHEGLCGLIADGVRVADVENFERAHGTRVACVLRIECPRETLLERLDKRGNRQGDERLGLTDTTDCKGRVDAYLQRAAADDAALRAHFDPAAIRTIDGAKPPEVCIRAATEALREAARAAGEDFAAALARAEAPARDSAGMEVDWAAQLRTTVARLDAEVHPDGRPRKRRSMERAEVDPDGRAQKRMRSMERV